jgi:hypothetical protein
VILSPDPLSGEPAKNSARLPTRLVLRSHSSAATITTAVRPLRVIVCGPRERANSMTSLNFAFAAATVPKMLEFQRICGSMRKLANERIIRGLRKEKRAVRAAGLDPKARKLREIHLVAYHTTCVHRDAVALRILQRHPHPVVGCEAHEELLVEARGVGHREDEQLVAILGLVVLWLSRPRPDRANLGRVGALLQMFHNLLSVGQSPQPHSRKSTT